MVVGKGHKVDAGMPERSGQLRFGQEAEFFANKLLAAACNR